MSPTYNERQNVPINAVQPSAHLLIIRQSLRNNLIVVQTYENGDRRDDSRTENNTAIRHVLCSAAKVLINACCNRFTACHAILIYSILVHTSDINEITLEKTLMSTFCYQCEQPRLKKNICYCLHFCIMLRHTRRTIGVLWVPLDPCQPHVIGRKITKMFSFFVVFSTIIAVFVAVILRAYFNQVIPEGLPLDQHHKLRIHGIVFQATGIVVHT